MILYSLTCQAPGCGKPFESWFKSSADHARLEEAGLLSCPVCGSGKVAKGLMAPAVGRAAQGADTVPADVRTALRNLRRKVEAAGENVGSRFADQALQMHAGKIASRPIYGDATEPEKRQMEDAGVPVARIPWVRLDDA